MRKLLGILFVVGAVFAATPMAVKIFNPSANEDALKFYKSITMVLVWENILIVAGIGLILIFLDELKRR